VSEQDLSQSIIDTTRAHPARRYNYWLGGKDNFAADRESADLIERQFPGMRAGVRANRDVLARMTRFLVAEARMQQFLDIGTGLPTAGNTHEVAQEIDPYARVLYVDNDPLVLTHARALLISDPLGMTSYIEADLREPATILNAPEFAATLKAGQPVALMLVAVLHFIHGAGAAKPIVDELMAALPSGSYLAATHFTTDYLPQHERDRYDELLASGKSDVWPRDRMEFEHLFHGLELVDPGVVLANQWRSTARPEADPSRIGILAAIGRKP
jgi:hypothetical protein